VQLVSGFYGIEYNAWRWSAGKFEVNLRPPADSAQKGANLIVRFSVPKPVLDKLGTIQLTATAGDRTIGTEQYSMPGEHVFRKPVPAELLAGDSVIFRFALDKSLAPGTIDQRELGVIVMSIGLEKAGG
jgi:hypothetical protein